MSTINTLITAALDDIYLQNPNFLFVVNRSDVELELQTALENVIPSDISLSMEKPDFEAIYLQCTQALQDKPLWKEFVPTAIGQTLIRNISSGITYLHNAVMRATQIAFLSPGTPKSSVYQALSHLGVNPRRKLPAKLPVQIKIPDHQNSFVIPKFTNFVINGMNFFNREDFVFTEFELIKNFVLVQGTKFVQSGIADGVPYEKLEIGYENFLISDEDVYVNVNNKAWKKADYLPWNAKKFENIYFVKTLETGNIEIMFGNNIFGKQLGGQDQVEVIWFETNGKSVDNIPVETIINQVINGASVDITTTGALFGMDDELDTEFYINMGSNMRSAEHGAVKRPDFPVVACRYPNVRDALFRGQAELNPGKRNWMNIVEATVLQSTMLPMSNIEWQSFVEHMQKDSIWQLEYLRRDPFMIDIDISGKLHCADASSLNMTKATKEVLIKNFNYPRRGAIGYSLFKSDIIQAIEGDTVEYITELDISYSSGFDPETLPEYSGFDEEGNIIADYYSYIRIKNVEFTPVYTPRRSYSGRRDFSIGQS